MGAKRQSPPKDEILASMHEVREAILAQALALPSQARRQAFLGTWSVMDLLAHLAGWDYANLEAIHAIMAAKIPAFYTYIDRDWQTYNAMLVEKYSMSSFAELQAFVRDSHRQLLELATSVSPEAFTRDYGVRFRGYKVTIQRLVQAELGDERTHLVQLEHFAGSLQEELSHP